jgi:CelD/BcsL family acetyltransferase involved in cellulose biosynthesis
MHVERHREIGATPLPEAMFLGALEHMLPQGKASFFFVRLAERPETLVAGGFYVHHGGVIDALMPAFRSEHAELAPNFLLAAHTLRWARAAGLRHYNWQGSPPEGGVRRFKLQWGSTDRTYRRRRARPGRLRGRDQARLSLAFRAALRCPRLHARREHPSQPA